jgi:tetratricopeptide (TPR) repeat protein
LRDRLGSGPATPPEGTPIPVPDRCFGRSDDTARIVAALTATTNPTAVVVHGPGGIGKTTVTQEAANHPSIVARFGHRRWFAELETATDRDTFDAQLLLALGLDPTQGFAAATHHLAQAPALLVLDNMETPWEGAGPAIEARVAALAAISGLAVLASFRGQEAVGGAGWTLRHRVAPLPRPEARALFLDIADSIPGGDPDLPALLDALGDVPLAICLTARRAAHRADLADLWAEWQRTGPEIATWLGATPGRLTSVSHSIALSLRSPRLNLDGHRLFTLLGQCPAGLAPADRNALLGDAAFAAEDGLVAVGIAYHRGPRLDLLPPVRDYAKRQCPPAEADAARWCRHFLDRTRTEGGRIFGDGGAEALADLTPEIANIDAALLAAPGLSLGEPAVAALGGAYRLLSASGAGSPAALDALARACAEAADTAGAAACHVWRGLLALDRSDHDTAQAGYEEALPLYRRLGDVLGEARCTEGLGNIALLRSDHDTARARYEEALPLYRRVGAVLGEANCIQRLGEIARARSEHDTARARYEEALPLYRRLGDVVGEAGCALGQGDVSLAEGDKAKAERHFHVALALYERVHRIDGIALARERLAQVTEGAQRAAHVRAAREAWLSMNLPAQAARVARRFA